MEKIKTIIKPASGTGLQLKEIWQYRELLYFFTWRDLKVKYKQTFLGILWALIQPLGLMALFVLIFSRSSLAPDGEFMSYEVFVLSGLVLWNLFYSAVSHASESMITNAAIIRKVYFPRLVIPVSSLLAAMVDFAIGFVLLLACCLIFKETILIERILYFLAGILIVLLTAFGLGALLGALNVKYRDFRYALPFLLQFLFFATGIIYPATMIRKQWLQTLLSFNPLNAAVELFRYPFGTTLEMSIVLTGLMVALVLAFTGLYYFRKTESYFADIV